MTPPSASLVDALAEIIAAGARHSAAVAAGLGLPVRDLVALSHVERLGGTSPHRLADALMLSSSGTTALVHRLAAAGLLERAESRTRGARTALTVTDQGRAVLDDLALWLREPVAAAAGELDRAQLAVVEHVLRRLAEGVERRADELVGQAAARAARAAPVPRPPQWG